MNLPTEFSKVRNSFVKVKQDLTSITKQIGENYETFLHEHSKLHSQVEKLAEEVRSHLNNINSNHKSGNISKKQLDKLKSEIKDLKSEIKDTHIENEKINEIIDIVRQNKNDVTDLKNRLQTSELEIYLLKEKLIEKDLQVDSLKQVSKHLFDLLDDIAKTEINLTKAKK
jgi:chromosome segregation ATPase